MIDERWRSTRRILAIRLDNLGDVLVTTPAIHAKGGDYTDEFLPEAESVREIGGRVVILPLAGSLSTTSVIKRIISLASEERIEVR